MRTATATILVFGAGAFMGSSVARGQNPEAIQQAEGWQRRQQAERSALGGDAAIGGAPELFLGELEDVGPQSILAIKQRRTYFQVGADSQFFFTSNMFLEEEDETETSLFVNTAFIALAPLPYAVGPGKMSPRLGFRHTWFNYGLGDSEELNDFDFDSQTVFTDMRYEFGKGWMAEAGFEWTRLLGHAPDYFDYPEFYKEYVPRWGVWKTVPLSERQTVTFGYQGTYRVTDTPDNPDEDLNDRTDHALVASYAHVLAARIAVQPYYRVQCTHYTNQDGRTDFVQTAGAVLSYAFNENAGARLFASYERRDSDDGLVADYEKYDAGIGLSLIWRF